MTEILSEKHDGQIAWDRLAHSGKEKAPPMKEEYASPAIIRWPDKIPSGRVNDAIFSTLDFMPTFATLAGYDVPSDRIIDGVDQTDLILVTMSWEHEVNFIISVKTKCKVFGRGSGSLFYPTSRCSMAM